MNLVAANSAFGLDISDSSIKLVELRRKFSFNKKVRIGLANFGSVNIPEGIITNGVITDKQKLVQTLKTFIKTGLRYPLRTHSVIASLPDRETFLTIVDVPRDAGNLSDQALASEIEKNIPVPIEEVYYAAAPLSNPQNTTKRRFLIGAVKRIISDHYSEALEEAGLTPLALEIESIALLRALHPFDMAPNSQTAIIDIGANRSSFIVAYNNVPEMAITLPISGNTFTRTIAERLGISTDKAEQIKVRCGFDVKLCDIELRTIVNHEISALATKIQESLKFHAGHIGEVTGTRPGTIILTGGGAHQKKIESVLSEKLKMKVRLGNPLTNLLPQSDDILPSIHSYTLAIGLALTPILGLSSIIDE